MVAELLRAPRTDDFRAERGLCRRNDRGKGDELMSDLPMGVAAALLGALSFNNESRRHAEVEGPIEEDCALRAQPDRRRFGRPDPRFWALWRRWRMRSSPNSNSPA
jgi:hypothetical protein